MFVQDCPLILRVLLTTLRVHLSPNPFVIVYLNDCSSTVNIRFKMVALLTGTAWYIRYCEAFVQGLRKSDRWACFLQTEIRLLNHASILSWFEAVIQAKADAEAQLSLRRFWQTCKRWERRLPDRLQLQRRNCWKNRERKRSWGVQWRRTSVNGRWLILFKFQLIMKTISFGCNAPRQGSANLVAGLSTSAWGMMTFGVCPDIWVCAETSKL